MPRNSFPVLFAPCGDIFKSAVIVGHYFEYLSRFQLLYLLLEFQQVHGTHHIHDIRRYIRLNVLDEFHLCHAALSFSFFILSAQSFYLHKLVPFEKVIECHIIEECFDLFPKGISREDASRSRQTLMQALPRIEGTR